MGVVAMAKAPTSRRGTSGSQFFIVTARRAAAARLRRCSAGSPPEQVVRRIARLATDPATEMPLDPVVIKKATIETRR